MNAPLFQFSCLIQGNSKNNLVIYKDSIKFYVKSIKNVYDLTNSPPKPHVIRCTQASISLSSFTPTKSYLIFSLVLIRSINSQKNNRYHPYLPSYKHTRFISKYHTKILTKDTSTSYNQIKLLLSLIM